MYTFTWIMILVMGVAKTKQEPLDSELLEEFERQFEKQKLDVENESHNIIADLQSFFRGHQNSSLLTGDQAGTIGLSEIHNVLPEVERQSECEGRSMLEISKNWVDQQVAKSLATQRQAAKSVSGMVLQHDVCKKAMPANCRTTIVADCARASHIYRSLDGSCNNLKLAERGAAMTRYNRFLPPEYDDRVDSMRGSNGRLPKPRKVTATLQKVGPFRPEHNPPLTLLHMQWGQLVSHDIAFTALSKPKGCCFRHQLSRRSPFEDCQAIDVSDDPIFDRAGRSCFFFVRSLVGGKQCTLGPREQVNQATHYLDGSGIYGTSEEKNRDLRAGRNGLLRLVQHDPQQMPVIPDKRSNFITGDPRVILTPALVSLQTLMVRTHNHIALTLKNLNPHWNDQKLFNEARKIVGALIQHITYRDYLPLVLGSDNMKKYELGVKTSGYSSTYKVDVDPTLANVFVAAAFRFGHSMVRGTFKLRGDNSMSLLHSFSQPKSVKNEGSRPSDFLDGMAKSRASWRDSFFTETLHNSFAATPKSPIGFDLFAISVQRGRDHGIPPYNEWRKACKLNTFADFDQMSKVMPPKVVTALRRLYRRVDDIDLFPAGLAEHAIKDSVLGPTFSCIVGQQFHNLKHGDRFWYENKVFVTPFTIEQLESIRKVGLASLLCEHTTITSLQPQPFLMPHNDRNKELPCSEYPKLDLSAWTERSSR